MSLLIATRNGVYRAEKTPFEEPNHVLNCGQTPRIRTFSQADGGEWRDLGGPTEEVWEVLYHDGALYAGTYPAAICRSTDDGEPGPNEMSVANTTSTRFSRSELGSISLSVVACRLRT